VLLGQDPGREHDDERILSYNIGLGLHDIFFTTKIYDMMEGRSCDSFVQERASEKFWV